MKKTLFIFSILLLFIFGNSLILEKNAVGAFIDFETVPGDTARDHLIINTQYKPVIDGGVTFSTNLLFGATGLERVGGVDPRPGFIYDHNYNPKNPQPLLYEDTEAPDIPPHLPGEEPPTLDDYYLRLGAAVLLDGEVPILIIDYTKPVSAASAEIWDIDAPQLIQDKYERWEVTAFGEDDVVLATEMSPMGKGALEVDSLDGKPWKWFFDPKKTENQAIYSIEIAFAGTKDEGIGLAFDNFDSVFVPIPGAIWLFGSGILGLVAIRRKLKK